MVAAVGLTKLVALMGVMVCLAVDVMTAATAGLVVSSSIEAEWPIYRDVPDCLMVLSSKAALSQTECFVSICTTTFVFDMCHLLLVSDLR